MRQLWMGCLLLVCATSVSAQEVTFIYRKADQLVVGKVGSAQTAAQEIDNLTKSELKGVASDYATVTVSANDLQANAGKDVTVDGNGKAVFVPNAEREGRKSALASAMTKLKALGLTPEEVKALVNTK